MPSYSTLAGTAFTLANLALAIMILNPMGTTNALKTKTSRDRRQRRQGNSNLLGGYKAIPVQDEDVKAAAMFVFETLQSDSSTYSISDDATDYKIVTASEQVVAGVNIKMQMTFVNSSGDCVGAATVVVYDRFGEMSITSYDYIENGCFVLLGKDRKWTEDYSTYETPENQMISLIKELSISSHLSRF